MTIEKKGSSTPLSSIKGGVITMVIPLTILQKMGEVIVASIVKEAKIDAAKQGFSGGGPEFYESFKYEIANNEIVIYCDWDRIIAGTKPKRPKRGKTEAEQKVYDRILHVTRDVVDISDQIPIRKSNGTMIMKVAPYTHSVWVHPLILEHTFINRGYKRAAVECAKLMFPLITKALQKINIFR